MQRSGNCWPVRMTMMPGKNSTREQRVTLQTEDNIRLSGLLYDQGGKETVVYLHNIGSAAGEDFYYAPWYWEKGYNILMPDNRAHGESEGNCASYGVYEAEDVNQWLQLICEKYGDDSQIIVHGDTLGAAAALMASVNYPEQVAFTVAESPVANLYDAAAYMMQKSVFIHSNFFCGSATGIAIKHTDFI